MMTITPLISEFTAIGELIDLTVKSDGRVKHLLLSAEEKEYSIKIPKYQPKKLISQLQPGCKLKVTGILKNQIKKDKFEYKASSIELLTAPKIEVPQTKVSETQKSLAKSKKSQKLSARILICKKSNCWKKGGKASYEALKNELHSRGLSEEVDIKLTGCLKKCKKAPNLIALPDKTQYTKVKPKQIATIVDKHLS